MGSEAAISDAGNAMASMSDAGDDMANMSDAGDYMQGEPDCPWGTEAEYQLLGNIDLLVGAMAP